MWVQTTWHSPPGHSAPATQRPAEIPSRTIYGLIAYLWQIAERISSDPFDPPLGHSIPATRRLAGLVSLVRVAVVERSDTTGEPSTCPRPAPLGHSAPAT